MRILIILITASILLSSCASILNTRYQRVEIITDQENNVLINGEKPRIKNGKYLLRRDEKSKIITISRSGYLDDHFIAYQYKRSHLYLLSWIPFSVLVLPPLVDAMPRAYNYDSKMYLNNRLIPSIEHKQSHTKEIVIDNIGVDLIIDSCYFTTFSSYKQFQTKKEKAKSTLLVDYDIEYKNTIFSDILNKILKEKGYIDTAKKVLKNSYLNNLYLSAHVTKLSINKVDRSIYYVDGDLGKLIFADLNVEWTIKDIYKNHIYSTQIQSKSSQFAINEGIESEKVLRQTISDAIAVNFNMVMDKREVKFFLEDKSQKIKEASYDTVYIPKNDNYASSVSEAVKACVTIKHRQSHGSGFIISPDGYIITNYHVIRDTGIIKVYLNNEEEYIAKVIQTSKINDLALLKIEGQNLNSLKISESKEFELASEIYVIGTPNSEDLSQSVSNGIISGVRKSDNNSSILQTDASINPGNSGGAIVNENGVAIGIVFSKLIGFGVEGVAFGIPSYEIFDKLKVNVK